MDELFAVDAEARHKTLTTAARHIRRQETARSLLDDIRSKIEAAQFVALPSSALSKACQYALARWKMLTRFLVERIGCTSAAYKRDRSEAILSVVESCRRLKISVRDYLATILPGLPQ
jgi:hypothetical protein